jgi:hypothetical protein
MDRLANGAQAVDASAIPDLVAFLQSEQKGINDGPQAKNYAYGGQSGKEGGV